MSKWMDIDTAPKDGTSILASSEYGNTSIVRWEDGHNGGWLGMCDGELSKQSEGDLYTDYHKPFVTHWMPLPDPPNGKDE